jgi:hypothetical protein
MRILWLDLWEGRVRSQAYPSYAKSPHISFSVAASTPLLQNLFHLPHSNEAYAEFQELSIILRNLQLTQANDGMFYLWGSSAFSSCKAYKHLIGHRDVHRAYKWLWKSACQKQAKILFLGWY